MLSNDVFEKLVNDAREIMEHSLDTEHDLIHIKHVEKHMMEALKELVLKGKILYTELESYRKKFVLAAWWHDVYKAGIKKSTFIDNVIEGEKSADIAKRYFMNVADVNDTVEILDAIRFHNQPWVVLDPFRKKNIVFQALIEGDGVEGFRIERLEQMYGKISGGLDFFFHSILHIGLSTFMFFYFKSEYSRSILKRSFWPKFGHIVNKVASRKKKGVMSIDVVVNSDLDRRNERKEST